MYCMFILFFGAMIQFDDHIFQMEPLKTSEIQDLNIIS